MILNQAQNKNEIEITRCNVCKIRSYSFCRCLKDEQLKIFSEISSDRSFVDNQNIFLQEENSDNLYNITQGNVEFIKGAVPEGVEAFKSKLNKDVQYKFKIPGIYTYWCTPHKSLGMIGFVIVGNDLSNKNDISNVKYFGKSKKIAEQLIEQLP